MKGTKLEQLESYLKGLGFAVASEFNLDSDEKNIDLKPGHTLFSQTGARGLLVGVIDYHGYVFIKGFTECNYTELEIISIIQVWLLKNDIFYNPKFNRNAYETGSGISKVPLDEGTNTDYDLSISVLFRELLVHIEDVNGKLPGIEDGKKYRLANQFLPAENFEIDFLKNK